MPLLDHFHEPLDPRADWQSFHHRWANVIADTLDQTLPPQYFARVEVNLGRDVAADVTESELIPVPESNGPGGGVAVQPYAPPVAALVLPGVFPDDTSVEVRDLDRGSRLVAVIELVSPANKARPDARRAFAAKCAAYLERGIGLIAVDVVTERLANLHDELARLMELGEPFRMPGGPPIYGVAYRPASRDGQSQIDMWYAVLAVGQPLPSLPLALRGAVCVPLDLEATYMETRRRMRFA